MMVRNALRHCKLESEMKNSLFLCREIFLSVSESSSLRELCYDSAYVMHHIRLYKKR